MRDGVFRQPVHEGVGQVDADARSHAGAGGLSEEASSFECDEGSRDDRRDRVVERSYRRRR